jgi:hypothetical protein
MNIMKIKPITIKRCPKSNKRQIVFNTSGWYTLGLPLIGFLSLIWILLRVLPKSSRVNYPCIKIAAPFASVFIAWFSGAILSGLALLKARQWYNSSERIIATTFAFMAIGSLLVLFGQGDQARSSLTQAQHEANQPMGEARGIHPGRVVWVYNPDATNENCNPGLYNHGWFLNENNDQEVIDGMLSSGIRQLTGSDTDSLAWVEIFKYFNQTHGRDPNSYQAGEKIFIKINATSSWGGNYNTSDLSKLNNSTYGVSETSPQLVFSVLKQLVNVVGVQEQNIYVGDPMRHIYKHSYDLWHGTFPNIHYLDHDGYTNLGREKVVEGSTAIIYYSDRGKVLREGKLSDATYGKPIYSDSLYTIFETADYLINIPTLKGHKRAGITAFAKNHFGSQIRAGAGHLHNGLVAPEEELVPRRGGYGLYRVQVDLMGSKFLEGKSLFLLLDALWTSDWEIHDPVKWMMAPFDNDWTSSIFLSQDPVAIESVGFDFLRSEFTAERGLETRPQMEGVDDYLHQAADSTNWPDSIWYDPENDGIVLHSLGVHEHWNDPIHKQYTRDLNTGDGIELIQIVPTLISGEQRSGLPGLFHLLPNHPNPFNASTIIHYQLAEESVVVLTIFDIQGRQEITLVDGQQYSGTYQITWDASALASGVYFCDLQVRIAGNIYQQINKMILIR